MRSSQVALFSALCLGLLASPAWSQAPAEPSRIEAEKLFTVGRNRFVEKKWQAALELLERSYRLYPSPNTLLLVGHCLNELGRPEDAAARFAEAAESAEARVAAGDASYEQTAAAARKEGAAVRAKLALLRVRVSPAKPDMRLKTPFIERAIPADGTTEVFHRPGEFVATVTWAGGGRAERTLVLERGKWATLAIDTHGAAPVRDAPRAAATRENPTPTAAADSSPGWLVPAAVTSGAISAVGFGVFIGFGLKSGATYDDLESDCGTNCSHRSDDVERGEREQTYANIGLAVGVVALATTVTLLLLNGGDGDEHASLATPGFRF